MKKLVDKLFYRMGYMPIRAVLPEIIVSHPAAVPVFATTWVPLAEFLLAKNEVDFRADLKDRVRAEIYSQLIPFEEWFYKVEPVDNSYYISLRLKVLAPEKPKNI